MREEHDEFLMPHPVKGAANVPGHYGNLVVLVAGFLADDSFVHECQGTGGASALGEAILKRVVECVVFKVGNES